MKSLLFLCALVCISLCYEALVGPTGLLRYDPERSFDGYTLFTQTESTDPSAYLLDMEGNVVHRWNLLYPAGLHGMLLDNGNLLIAGSLPRERKPALFGGSGGGIYEYDWDSNLVWSHEMLSDTEMQHHTFHPRPNGDVMLLGWEKVTREEYIELGRNADDLPESVVYRGLAHTHVWTDFVRSVNRAGETVWEWHAKDHLGVGYDKIDPNHFLPNNQIFNFDPTHFNTLTFNEETQTVMMCSRNNGEVYHVDYKTGEIVWRFGSPAAYSQGANPSWYSDGDRELYGPHHATFLPNGNIQIFDNGAERVTGSYSRVVEVDPATDEIVWQYRAWISNSFFTKYQGAAQRLPNDNVLVTSSNKGHLFEITREGAVVWDFVNPHSSLWSTPRCVIKDRDQPAFWHEKNFLVNMIHRAERLSPDHPGLQGKDLTPKGPLTHCPSFYRLYQDFQGDSTSFIRQGLE
eukprot:gnl/Dysnectes_brevis/1229_a1373_2948.p1 GENE.gnl/Dysnectes_brevis/1229_a1373_2948~~gnl/Dysnectes_brevis/1229_a1373_2948.p1  ORF type:complete len:460 (+),score=167.39 gnl/Dysnectes_brevis/1229_a1373_2948:143-1522(+)